MSLRYDRAGRSEGVAQVSYKHLSDAEIAIREFDGANAKGQPIRLTLLSSRNGYNSSQKGSLFSRTERPRSFSSDSHSPERGQRRSWRSNISKPPPDNIDRYVPEERSPRRSGGGRRRKGRNRREGRARNGGTRSVGGRRRPKKTQEELDQEMEDYWDTSAPAASSGGGESTEPLAAPAEADTGNTAPTPAGPAANDGDIDMIE